MSEAEEMNEIEAVKIKHRGPCPKPKGHAIESVCVAFLMGAWAMLMVVLIFSVFVMPNDKAEAIKRGYAIYNPTTAQFQWR